jgi:phosphoribosyl 1,2-cyclic phosphodiesterase
LESDDGSRVILDCGSGIRDCGKHLAGDNLPDGGIIDILQSHTHWDHIMGFPFFAPAYDPRAHIRIHGSHPDLRQRFDQLMDRVHFPITIEDMAAKVSFHHVEPGCPHPLTPFMVESCMLVHPGDAFAYRINDGHVSVVYATDGEYKDPGGESLDTAISFCSDADILIFDAMYATIEQSVEKEDYGHSTAIIGVDLALAAGVKKLVLFHHDPECDDRQIIRAWERAIHYREMEKKRFKRSKLEIVTAWDGMEMRV